MQLTFLDQEKEWTAKQRKDVCAALYADHFAKLCAKWNATDYVLKLWPHDVVRLGSDFNTCTVCDVIPYNSAKELFFPEHFKPIIMNKDPYEIAKTLFYDEDGTPPPFSVGLIDLEITPQSHIKVSFGRFSGSDWSETQRLPVLV